MLKRNDEKSAEYIARHGGGPLADAPSSHSNLTHDPIATVGDHDVHFAAAAAAAAAAKFNRAPGSNKPQPTVKKSGDTSKTAAPENVWNKRRRDEEERRRQIDEQQRVRAVSLTIDRRHYTNQIAG